MPIILARRAGEELQRTGRVVYSPLHATRPIKAPRPSHIRVSRLLDRTADQLPVRRDSYDSGDESPTEKMLVAPLDFLSRIRNADELARSIRPLHHRL